MAKYYPGPLPEVLPAGCFVLQQTEGGYVCMTEHDLETGNVIDLTKIDLTQPYEQLEKPA